MATSLDYIQFVCEQLHTPFPVYYKKMFGEYMIYVNDKPILLVCDNTVYVKKLEVLKDIMNNSACGIPYKGAKEHYILDVEEVEFTSKVIELLEKNTIQKKRKTK